MIENLFLLFFTFFKIGLFTIGGGYAMIPLIQRDVVNHGWMSLSELTDFIGIAESTPGPFAVNIATFVGMKQNHIIGAVCATLGVILPSFLIILFIAKWFMNFKTNKFVQASLNGLRPAVVGLIAAAVFSIGKEVFFNFSQVINFETFLNSINFIGIIIFVIIFFINKKFKPHPFKIIIISALLGILFFGAKDLIIYLNAK